MTRSFLSLSCFMRKYSLTLSRVRDLEKFGIVEIQQNGYIGHILEHHKIVVFDRKNLETRLTVKRKISSLHLGPKTNAMKYSRRFQKYLETLVYLKRCEELHIVLPHEDPDVLRKESWEKFVGAQQGIKISEIF